MRNYGANYPGLKNNIEHLQNSGCLPNETPEEKALIGYAQISISSE